MNWQEVCDHPALRNLPFKIELNEKGQIVMSPVKVLHSFYQGEIEHLLRSLIRTGSAMPEYAISTRKGTKVADVAWISSERLRRVIHETDSPIAPEICVEILSDSNTVEEMAEKRQLYFEKGAREVWLCAENGEMYFFDADGPMERSRFAPDFPLKIELRLDR